MAKNDMDFERFVSELKDKADLIDVIEATSDYRFDERRVGRFVKCKHPDSFMVDPDWGVYTMFAKAGEAGQQYETGDVFHWLERYANMSFWEAATWLGQRYGVKVPERRNVDPEKEKQQRSRLEMYEIACQWFEQELWNTPAAVDYCHGRGWTDETIRAARLGFAPGIARLNDLRGTLSMNDVNLDDPAAVSIVGKRGGVAAWILTHSIEDASADWIDNDHINGLATFPRLVYPHIWRGRVNYFSARNLDWSEERLVNRDKPKSWNLPRSLAGERMRYYNFTFTRGAEKCLVIEGQPDAISAGQLGIAAVALVGVGADKELADQMKQFKIERVFMGLDNDKVGQENQVKQAEHFGPMTRLVTWVDDAQSSTTTEPEELDGDTKQD